MKYSPTPGKMAPTMAVREEALLNSLGQNKQALEPGAISRQPIRSVRSHHSEERTLTGATLTSAAAPQTRA